MPHVGVEWFTRLSLADRGQDAAKAQRLCVRDDHQISKALRRLHVPTLLQSADMIRNYSLLSPVSTPSLSSDWVELSWSGSCSEE